MRKLGWFVVSAAVGALVVFGVLLLAANLYVQSQGAQQWIRQTLANALHVPVSLKKTTLTPWEGLRLDGIVLHVGSGPNKPGVADGDLLTVDSFRVRVALWPLLHQRLVVVESVLLDHPRLAWTQNPEGRWVWPSDPPKKTLKAGGSPDKPLPAVSPTAPPAAGPGAPAGVVKPSVFPELAAALPSTRAKSMDLPKIRVRHGCLDLLNGRRKILGRLEEVDLDGKWRDDGRAEGELRCQHALLARPGLRLTNFRSGFRFDEAEGLSIDGGTGEFAGGILRADYKLSTRDDGSPFSADCQVRNVELAELLKAAGTRMQLVEGRLQGGVQLEGSTNDPASRHAVGKFRLVGAELRDFPILRVLGEMLRIRDLSRLQFKEAQLNCQLDGDNLQIAPLTLVSNDLQISAQGQYLTSKDRIDLHGRLTIDPAIGRQLPQFIRTNFTVCGQDDPGCRYIDFDVTGPLSKPTTNLFDRMLAGPANGLLQNLLAPKPKKSRTKIPRVDAPAAEPNASNDVTGS